MFCGLGIWILDFEVRREAVAVRREGDVGVDVGGFVYDAVLNHGFEA